MNKQELLELAAKWRRMAQAERQYKSDYGKGMAYAWEAAADDLERALK